MLDSRELRHANRSTIVLLITHVNRSRDIVCFALQVFKLATVLTHGANSRIQVFEMHGGSIAVRSEGPVQGSESTIRLPRSLPPTAHAIKSEEPDRDDTSIRTLRILIVEDNPDARDMMADALTEKGHDVRAAVDGPRRLRRLKSGARILRCCLSAFRV